MNTAGFQTGSGRFSTVSLLKTQHAELRLLQRRIAESSVEETIEKGTCKRHKGPKKTRLIYEYEKQIVVAETDGTVVTTYLQLPPLSTVYIDEQTQTSRLQCLEALCLFPERATFHTVFIVDSSASMKTCDVHDAKNRWERAFRTVATDFVADRIVEGSGEETDLFSLITFSASQEGPQPPATVIFERQPLDPVLFNRVVEASKQTPKRNGLYLEGMRQAAEVLKKDKALGGSYPLTVIFFSDGRPSDVGKPGMVRNRILAAVRELCKGYGNRLSFIVLPMVGLTGVQDFSVLKEMKEAAKSAGCEADYIPPEDLRGMFALTSWMTAICAQSVFSRASMVVLGSQLPQDLIKRHVQREREDAERLRGQTHPDEAWQVVGGDKAGPQRRSLTFAQGYSDREWRIPFLPVPFLHEEADGFAVRRAAFGIGRERVVFFFREVKGAASENPTFVGDLMVAKESKCVISDENRKTGFHGIYCKLLTDARRIAKKFNEHIRRINIGTSNVSLRIPTVNFLDASVYTFVDDERGGERRGLLVEPFLSSWDKWNNNDGWVKGVEMGVALRRRMFGPEGREGNEKKAQGRFKPNLPFGCSEKGPGGIVVSSSEMGMQLDPIVEEEEGGGEESEDEQIGDRMQKGPPRSDVFCSSFNSVSSSSSSLSLEGGRKVEHDDVPQALSHFSHFVTANNRTGRKLLIDLQGAPPTVKENEKGGELSFDLTDPAICCADPQQKLGCTNKGQTGIDAFFKTHQRNQVCKLLGLPGK